MVGIKVVGRRLLVARGGRRERDAPRPPERCDRGPVDQQRLARRHEHQRHRHRPQRRRLHHRLRATGALPDPRRRAPQPERRRCRTFPSSSNGRNRRTRIYEPGFLEANGIVVTPDGRYLLVVHFSDGILFRVRLSDKQVSEVDLGGYRLISGDGWSSPTTTSSTSFARPARSSPSSASTRATERGRLLSETTDPSFHGPDDGGDRRRSAARRQQPVHRTAPVGSAVDGVEHPPSLITDGNS